MYIPRENLRENSSLKNATAPTKENTFSLKLETGLL